MSFAERLKEFIEFKRTNIRAFELESGLKNGTVYRVIKDNKSLNGDSIAAIGNHWKDLNLTWLLTGAGVMLIPNTNTIKETQEEEENKNSSTNAKWNKDALLNRADNQIQLQQEMINLLKEIIERQKKAAEQAGLEL